MKKLLVCALCLLSIIIADARKTYNFNSGWIIDRQKMVTLPHAWNEDEAFKVPIASLSDSVVWYRKYFSLPKSASGQRVFIEFEGARQAAEVWLNGRRLGISENGVMAFGFELTGDVKREDNLIEVRTDNAWNYHSVVTKSQYQWNNSNFNANYGGLPKNVRLYICPPTYQTLPLYSSLGTTGVYVYGSDYNIQNNTATIHVESQVRNSSAKPVAVNCKVIVEDNNGRVVSTFTGEKTLIDANNTQMLEASKTVSGLHFWSWGYGYLYRVKTIVDNDTVTTITGFRKTEYGKGVFRLNNRVMMIHGFAQRTSNEWPGVGMSVPAWLSDYSNDMMVKGCGNLVRWMHVTPWKQDVESCDRVGLIEATPAGDAEGDVTGERWQQRIDLMRDAIIYNRNNPSICFYECGNHGISKEHFLQMKAIRDSFDINGGRAIGSREMLDIPESEYGGEMLYINKSKTHPMWMMEYCRDEGLRKYWNSWSYPYHKEGDGPLYRKAPADAYNHNQDEFAVELVRRWYDYWLERPGTGTMVNSGGVKIVFSDTQTHCRGAENYRCSGVVDAMRIPKDGFYAQQVMWNGWVDDLKPQTYIVGMWNYKSGEIIPKVYVISNGDSVALFNNGYRVNIAAKRQNKFIFVYDDVPYDAGTLEALSYDAVGKESSRYKIETVGEPDHIKLTTIQNPIGWKADGADVTLVQVEIVDKQGLRCPLDNRLIHFKIKGEAEWRGGIAQGKDNYVLQDTLPVECGVNRVMLRSTTKAGNVVVSASAIGMESVSVKMNTVNVDVRKGLSKLFPSDGLKCRLDRGETPLTASFVQKGVDVRIKSVEAGSNEDNAALSYDENEKTEWDSDGNLNNAWITYTLERKVSIDNICIKLSAFRSKSYPIVVYARNKKVWEGYTGKSLGYYHIPLNGVISDQFTVKMIGETTDKDAFGAVTELDKNNNDKNVSGKTVLRIVETQFISKSE
jgi:beta-galactosidase